MLKKLIKEVEMLIEEYLAKVEVGQIEDIRLKEDNANA